MPFWTIMLSLSAIISAQGPEEGHPGLTRHQARGLSPQEVAAITLRELAEQVQEVSRPTYQGMPYPDTRLRFLNFALAPEAVAPGLCRATVITVNYESDLPESTDGENLPVHPRHISTHSVYRVAGDLDWGGRWEAEDRARQLASCRWAGPVITADTLDVSQPAYFGFTGALNIRPAVEAVQRALAEARAGIAIDLQCAPQQFSFDPCEDPRAFLQPVTLDDLSGISSEFIRESRYRVTANFRDAAHRDRQSQIGVEFEVETNAAGRATRIGAIRVRRFVVMVD